jgi:hypothetical protein
MDGITYDVRVYAISVYEGASVTSYTVRWKVAGKIWQETFRNSAQADSFRSSLVTVTRSGEAFKVTTGRPVSWKAEEAAPIQSQVSLPRPTPGGYSTPRRRTSTASDAATTARRHRMILANSLDYASSLRIIDAPANPIRALKWSPPPMTTVVDRRCVVNPDQARALLAAVGEQEPGTQWPCF